MCKVIYNIDTSAYAILSLLGEVSVMSKYEVTQAFRIKVSLVSIDGFISSMRVFQNSWTEF